MVTIHSSLYGAVSGVMGSTSNKLDATLPCASPLGQLQHNFLSGGHLTNGAELVTRVADKVAGARQPDATVTGDWRWPENEKETPLLGPIVEPADLGIDARGTIPPPGNRYLEMDAFAPGFGNRKEWEGSANTPG